jgi:hypothetical protein
MFLLPDQPEGMGQCGKLDTSQDNRQIQAGTNQQRQYRRSPDKIGQGGYQGFNGLHRVSLRVVDCPLVGRAGCSAALRYRNWLKKSGKN